MCQLFLFVLPIKRQNNVTEINNGIKYIVSGKNASILFTERSELRKVLFLALSVCSFCHVYEISREPLNGFSPNSHGRRVWSLARTSLKVKVKVQRSRSPGTKTTFSRGLRAVYICASNSRFFSLD